MNSDKERDYLNNYQYNHFQSTINDPYKNLDIRRQCLVQTVTACHALNKENLAGTILQEKLKEYGEMVDENHKINNYGSSIKYLASNVDKSHCMQWKNELKVEDFTDLINNLQCCSNNAIPDNGIDILFQKNPKLLVNDTKISLNSNKNQFHFQKRSVENNINKNEIYVQNIQKNEPKENSSNQAVKRNNFAMFKTARDEFEVQNAKKHKLNQNSNQPQPNGGVKKSLGARRGVQGKFIPPVRAEPNEDGTLSLCRQNNSPSWDSEEIVDERLKNIDPKMIELIRSEIMDSGASISWDDIAGLEFAKTIIKEVVVWPLLRPDIFTGLRRPPKGILLFGPPGTGKTLIGKCIASQSQSTFFSISASSLTSKWIGDGEKMVRAMFAVARCHQPAVVFIDEIDSLLSQRSDTEHESSRRIKTEFLVQLDGAATGDEDRILVIGATNRPQELDEAARRRFVKRLYIPLPEKPARLEIIKRLMSNERHELSEENIIKVADLSKGYSGADMKSLCAEASLGPIRSLDISMIQNIQADQVRPITMQDFQSALNRVRASVSPRDLEQYVTWDRTYGAGGW